MNTADASGAWEPADELAHDSAELEIWNGDWVDADSGIAGFSRLIRDRASATTAFWLYIFGPSGVTAVRDDAVPEVPSGPDLGMRGPGLWCQYMCETPFEHWSLQMEAFGVTVADGRELAQSELGDRSAVGLDIEFETSGAAEVIKGGYRLSGIWTGDVLLDAESFDLNATGVWWHVWGSAAMPPLGAWTSSDGRISFLSPEESDRTGRVEILKIPDHSQAGRISSDRYIERSALFDICSEGTGAGIVHGLGELHTND